MSAAITKTRLLSAEIIPAVNRSGSEDVRGMHCVCVCVLHVQTT